MEKTLKKTNAYRPSLTIVKREPMLLPPPSIHLHDKKFPQVKLPEPVYGFIKPRKHDPL